MKNILKVLILVSAITLVSCTKNADEIVQKNAEARGAATLKDIKNIYFEGAATSMGMAMPFKMYIQTPDKLRLEIESMGSGITTIANGDKAWQIDSVAREIPGYRPENAKETMDFQFKTIESDLINYKEKGSKLELMDDDTAKGKPAYRLKLTLKDSSVITYYIDKDTYLEVKSISKSKIMGQEIEQTIYYSDYQKVGNFNVPFNWTYAMKDSKGSESVHQVLQYKAIKVNEKWDAAIFAQPANIQPIQPPPLANDTK